MDLIEFFQLLLRRKWIILTVTSIAVITTFLITQVRDREYKATAQLSTNITSNRAAAFSESLDTRDKYEAEARLNNLAEVIRSRQVLALLSYKLALHDLDLREPFRNIDAVRSQFSESELETARANFRTKLDSMQLLVTGDELEKKHLRILELLGYDHSSLLKDLKVRRIAGTDFLEISFTAENPFLAAFAVNNLCQEFIRYNQSVRTRQANSSVKLLTRLTEEKRDAYQKALTTLSTEGADPAALSGSQEVTRLELARLEVLNRLQTLEILQTDLQNQLTQPELKALESAFSFDDPRVLSWQVGIAALNDQIMEGQVIPYSDSLQAVQRAFESYVVSKAQGDQAPFSPEQLERVRNLAGARISIDVLRDRLRSIDRGLANTMKYVDGTSATSPQGMAIDRARTDYLVALNRLNAARLAALSPDGVLSQVATVAPPDYPEPSRAFLLVTVAAMGALALCLMVIFFLEYIDVSLRYPSTFTKITGVPLIGALNRLPRGNLDIRGLFDQTSSNPQLETYKNRIRQIRSALTDSGARSFMLVSPRQGFGKTSTMVSLGYALSLYKAKVLLIDANFRNPALTKIVGAPAELEEILSGRQRFTQASVHNTFEHVDVLGCAGGNATPLELFPANVWQQFITEMLTRYDLVLIEGAPLNQFADARELVPLAEKVVVVFSATAYVHEVDQRSFDYLKTLGDRLLGAILNQVELSNLER